MNVLTHAPGIKIVSSQAADWDASKSRSITETVLQQHPGLCAVIDVALGWTGPRQRCGHPASRQAWQGPARHLGRWCPEPMRRIERWHLRRLTGGERYDAAGMRARHRHHHGDAASRPSQSPSFTMKFQAYSPIRVMRKQDIVVGTCWNVDDYAKVLR